MNKDRIQKIRTAKINGFEFTLSESGVYHSGLLPNYADDRFFEAITEAREIWRNTFAVAPIYLYIMSSDIAHVVKIGISVNPKERRKAVGGRRVLNAIPFANRAEARNYESGLHKFFGENLYPSYFEREWFKLSDFQIIQLTQAHTKAQLCEIMGIVDKYQQFGDRPNFKPSKYVNGIHPVNLTREQITKMGGGWRQHYPEWYQQVDKNEDE